MQQTAETAVHENCVVVVGLDLGDRWSRYCILDASGTVLEEDRVRSHAEAMREKFATLSCARIVIETGTHSPWVSRFG